MSLSGWQCPCHFPFSVHGASMAFYQSIPTFTTCLRMPVTPTSFLIPLVNLPSYKSQRKFKMGICSTSPYTESLTHSLSYLQFERCPSTACSRWHSNLLPPRLPGLLPAPRPPLLATSCYQANVVESPHLKQQEDGASEQITSRKRNLSCLTTGEILSLVLLQVCEESKA